MAWGSGEEVQANQGIGDGVGWRGGTCESRRWGMAWVSGEEVQVNQGGGVWCGTTGTRRRRIMKKGVLWDGREEEPGACGASRRGMAWVARRRCEEGSWVEMG